MRYKALQARGWRLANNILKDAVASMTRGDATFRASSAEPWRRQRGGVEADLDDAASAMRHAVHGLEHDAVEALNAEVAKL